MVKSDTTNRYNGLIQRCEDICGLGPTGITSNSELYSKFIGFLNQWNNMFAHFAIMAWDGADFDDPGYTTEPHGTFVGTTNRDYEFDSSLAMLKLKLVNVTYDGVNYVPAKAIDAQDKRRRALNDPNVDLLFNAQYPEYDLRANGFDLYPKFTTAQVALNAAVYAEFFRLPRQFDTTSGTDLYQPCIDFQFHHLPAIGASYEYCRIYKQDAAADLQGELYGVYYRGRLIKKGVIDEVQEWYASKSPTRPRMTMKSRRKI